jgi:hypothetical protein
MLILLDNFSLKYIIRFLKILWHWVLILTTLGPKYACLQNGDLLDIENSDAVPLLCTHRFVESQTYSHADTLPRRRGSNTPLTLNIGTRWRWVIASYCCRFTSGTCWTAILVYVVSKKNPTLTEHRPRLFSPWLTELLCCIEGREFAVFLFVTQQIHCVITNLLFTYNVFYLKCFTF